MHLARFPRRRYTPGPTPDRAPAAAERGARRALTSTLSATTSPASTGGGNKTRKLEFLVADALAQGADALVTVGARPVQPLPSHPAAAVREGLRCRLVLEERVPGSYDPAASGNNFLFDLLGAEAISVVQAGADLNAAMRAHADEVRAAGRTPYVIPGGGSNALGALGYVACAEELLAQTFDTGLALDAVVCASGSAGTHAGLLVGLHGSSAQMPLVGVNVRRPRAEQEGNVHALAVQTAALLGVDAPGRESVVAHDDWIGGGYSHRHAPRWWRRSACSPASKGVLLDPVYTGKAMAGLIGLVRRGDFRQGQKVLFVHTGGSPRALRLPGQAY
jgi:D-cysteine desulfhydrase